MRKPSVIFMGSKPGAVVALSILLKREWRVKYVVGSRTIGHHWVAGQTLEELASSNGIKVITQEQLPRNETVDFVISYMYRHLVKPETLAMARRAALNFHAAPLPEYGGFAFYNVAILENASEYGVTCHYMNEEFDKGPILKVRRFPIDAQQETAYSLERKSQEEMIRLFVDFCHIAETQEILPSEEQDKSRMRYLTQKEFEVLKEIPRNADAEMLERYARAFWYPPYPGAYIRIDDRKVEVVPRIVKDELARLLHEDDLEHLQKVARDYELEVLR